MRIEKCTDGWTRIAISHKEADDILLSEMWHWCKERFGICYTIESLDGYHAIWDALADRYGDEYFFQFKHDANAMMFMLRWS